MPAFYFQRDGFGVTGRIGQRFAPVFLIEIDRQPLQLVSVAEAQCLKQPLDVVVLFRGLRRFFGCDQCIFSGLFLLTQEFVRLLQSLFHISRLGIEERGELGIELRFFEFSFARCFGDLGELFSDQRILFVFVEFLHALQDLGVFWVIRVTLQMVEVPREGATLLRRHITIG